MYMSLSLGMIIILLPLLLLAFLIAVGVVLYRHPSKLQKKWYQVSLRKRRRVKQAGIFLGFCAAAALFIYPLANGEKFVSTIRLSAKERNLITKNKIKKEIYHECFLSDGASYFKYIAAFVGTCSFEFL